MSSRSSCVWNGIVQKSWYLSSIHSITSILWKWERIISPWKWLESNSCPFEYVLKNGLKKNPVGSRHLIIGFIVLGLFSHFSTIRIICNIRISVKCYRFVAVDALFGIMINRKETTKRFSIWQLTNKSLRALEIPNWISYSRITQLSPDLQSRYVVVFRFLPSWANIQSKISCREKHRLEILTDSKVVLIL